MFLRRIWTQSYRLASRQLEETYCDFLGIYIFGLGRSFLYAFRYLLAPSLGQYRAVHYPSLRNRVSHLEHAARSYGIGRLESFNAGAFDDSAPNLSPNDQFIVEMADLVTERLYENVLDVVERFHGNVEPFSVGAPDEQRLYESLRKLMPPTPVTSISALVNAAWDIRLSLSTWNILSRIKDEHRRSKEKVRVLRDLVLKGMEVYEYRKRLGVHAT
jgi:hypothetical protein